MKRNLRILFRPYVTRNYRKNTCNLSTLPLTLTYDKYHI